MQKNVFFQNFFLIFAPSNTIITEEKLMKRLILLAAIVAATATSAHAQFAQGTKYIAASLTGLGASYSKTSEFNLGLNAEGGYYFADAWSAQVHFGYNHAKTLDSFTLGAGARYHFLQNGIFLGAGLEYAFDKYTSIRAVGIQTVTNDRTVYFDQATNTIIGTPDVKTTYDMDIHEAKTSDRYNNIRIPVEIGYTFYLNHFLAIEPAVYSKMSLNHFSEGTEFGLKIGLGFYFNRLHNVSHTYYRPRTYEPVN